jgi:hypothetical protein
MNPLPDPESAADVGVTFPAAAGAASVLGRPRRERFGYCCTGEPTGIVTTLLVFRP